MLCSCTPSIYACTAVQLTKGLGEGEYSSAGVELNTRSVSHITAPIVLKQLCQSQLTESFTSGNAWMVQSIANLPQICTQKQMGLDFPSGGYYCIKKIKKIKNVLVKPFVYMITSEQCYFCIYYNVSHLVLSYTV